jgi:hypothetical protein
VAGPCVADTDCIALAVNGLGELEASLIISPDAGNDLECRANGAFASIPGAVIQTATAAAAGPFNVTAVSPSSNIVQTSTFTITNPSATRAARYLAIADLGSVDFFVVPAGNTASSLVRKATLPGALVQRHQYVFGPTSVTFRGEDAACPEFFSGTLAAGGSVQVQVQRAVQRIGAGVGTIQGRVGSINWIGLVVPA